MEGRVGVTGARRLLGGLRDVMAGEGNAQERLDRIVQLIAADMVAEVCSAYIMRAGDILELCATEGLFPESVHRTRLRVGEGLVGAIAATARPLALSDAQAHPAFAYRPETGEEVYHSLMGVPILRSGRVASPIDASSVSPTFLLDFRVFPGNSGGPVFISDPDRRDPASDAAAPAQFIAGMLTQQVELNHERLEIGIVTEAAFIRDTLTLLDKPSSGLGPTPAADPPAAKIAAATQPAAQPTKPSQPIEAIVGTAVNE